MLVVSCYYYPSIHLSTYLSIHLSGIRLDTGVFGDNVRIVLGAFEPTIFGEDDVFVGDDGFESGAFLNVATLHEDGVFDDSTFSDIDAAEDNGVLDGAADLATIGDERIFDVGRVFVLNGDFIFDLGENGTVWVEEEFRPNVGVETIAVSLIKFHGGIDVSDVTLMMISGDFEVIGVANKSVKEEVLAAAFISGANEISESRNGHKISAHDVFLTLFDSGNFSEVSDDAVIVGFDKDGFAVAVGSGIGID